jgi:hypothetical protein
MGMTLPRQLDDYSFKTHLKRNLIHRSMYFKKTTVKRLLEHLMQTCLYKRYNIVIDPTFLNVDNMPEDIYEFGELDKHFSNIECLLGLQHMLLWNKDKYLEIFPRRHLMKLGKQNVVKTLFNLTASEMCGDVCRQVSCKWTKVLVVPRYISPNNPSDNWKF